MGVPLDGHQCTPECDAEPHLAAYRVVIQKRYEYSEDDIAYREDNYWEEEETKQAL